MADGDDQQLAELRQDVRWLKDRAEILDCIAAHARGCDRHDTDLLSGTYHADGVDVHGTVVNAGPEYAGWVNTVHAATSQNHLHNITTHSCEIVGDDAHAESYVMVTLLSSEATADAPTARAAATVMCGRYVDRLERRDGRWRIAVRRATVEVAFTADARLLQSRYFLERGYERGSRDRSDLSYERPLSAGVGTDAGASA
jgi:hypothetical protein